MSPQPMFRLLPALAALAALVALTQLTLSLPAWAATPATAAQRALQRYELVRTDGPRHQRVGVVTLDADGRLALVWARRADARHLRERMAALNTESQLYLDAPAPASAPQFANTSQVVPRGDPRFTEALRQHLQRYDDLLLRPTR